MAGRSCTVCPLPVAASIDLDLTRGDPEAEVARRYGVPRSNIQRHKRKCILGKMVKAGRSGHRRSVLEGKTLLDKVIALSGRAEGILERNDGENDAIALGAVRELRGCLHELGVVSGELARAEAKAWWQELQLPSLAAAQAAAAMWKLAQDRESVDMEQAFLDRAAKLVRLDAGFRDRLLSAIGMSEVAQDDATRAPAARAGQNGGGLALGHENENGGP